MSNNKQSSVDYLIKQVKSKEWQDKFIWHKENVFEQAKEMHKQEIIRAGADHCYPSEEIAIQDAEQYYNETFKKTEQ